MAGYLARRFVQMFLVALVAAICAYGMLYLVPGGPIDQLLAERQNAGPKSNYRSRYSPRARAI